MALPARFWAKVDKTGDCWVWTANLTKHNGYGRFHLDGRMVLAHRLAYQDANGPIPEGMQLDHLCRTKTCVRPDHLEPVTNRENVVRALRQVRTHCKWGHPLVFNGAGCPECAQRRKRVWEQARKQDEAYRDRRRELERARYRERMKDPEFRAQQAARQRELHARRKESV